LADAGIAAGGRPELGVAEPGRPEAGIAPGREDGIGAPGLAGEADVAALGRAEAGSAEPGFAGALPGGGAGLLSVFESLMLRP
jgi:hypothetical protein